MSLVGSKAGNQSIDAPAHASLNEKTTSLQYWQYALSIEGKARQLALLEYLEGKRQVLTKPDCPSQEVHFKNFLDKESSSKAALTASKWKDWTSNDQLLQEALRVQNDPSDPNPFPQGKPRSPQEAKEWRALVPVSKQGVMQYFTLRTQQTLEDQNHPGSKALVQEFLSAKYFSVYSDDLTELQMAQALAAKPLDSLELDHFIDLEVSHDTSIIRYQPGDDLVMIKSKIADLTAAEKSFNEHDALCTKNSITSDKLNGELEAFLLKHMPIASSVCPDELRQKKYALVWKLVNEHFIAKTKRSPTKATNATLRDFNSRTDSVASYQRMVGEHLGQQQAVAQEAHVGSRVLKKVSYLEASTQCLLLTDAQWDLKFPPREWAGKETKDVHIREFLREKFESTPLLAERITMEERKNPDVAAKELFEALLNEETLHSTQKMNGNSCGSKTSVNAVSSESGNDSLTCAIHGPGNHDTDNCRMLKQETVIFDSKKNSYVYKDSGVPYKGGGKTSHSDKSHADGPKPKKDKKDHKFSGKKDDKKKNEKKDPKDNEKEKQKQRQKEKEKKKNKEVIAALDSLKTTFVNLLQSQSSSSSATAVSAPTSAQAVPSQDGVILAALDKHFVDLKKSIGLDDP